MQKVIIADNSADFSALLSGMLRSRFLVEVCTDGKTALERLRTEAVDALVMDLLVPELDGMELLKLVHEEHLASAVVVTSRFLSDYMVASLSHYGVDYAAVKPCSAASLADRVEELCDGFSRDRNGGAADPYCAVSSILLALGFQTHRKGFLYCRDCILRLAEHPGLQVTKHVYPDTGKSFGAYGSAVEKAIRVAITDAWEHRDNAVWRLYFPTAPSGDVPKPTNTEFLTRIADTVASGQRAAGKW